MDWRGACIVTLYKEKGDKCECSNSRGISLLSIVGKLIGRVLIRAGTECAIGRSNGLVAAICTHWTSCYLQMIQH